MMRKRILPAPEEIQQGIILTADGIIEVESTGGCLIIEYSLMRRPSVQLDIGGF